MPYLRSKFIYSPVLLCSTLVLIAVIAPVQAANLTACASGCMYPDAQSAIDAASPGDNIYLNGGETYGNIVLHGKAGGGSGVITIQPMPNQMAMMPGPGVRVNPHDAPYMPKIVGQPGGTAVDTDTGVIPATNYRLLGLEITMTDISYIIVNLGDGNATSVSAQPDGIEIDRCYIHGLYGDNSQEGIIANTRSLIVHNSYISGIHFQGVESHAIAGYNGPGPFTFTNNYLEAAGIGILFGGSAPAVPNLVPSNIDIEQNYFYKPKAWMLKDPNYDGYGWLVKNMFEVKNGQNITFAHNFLENNWVHAQNGSCSLMTVRTCEGGGDTPNATVSNVAMVNNVFHSSAAGLEISGKDGGEATGCGWTDSILAYVGSDVRFPCNYPGQGTLLSTGTTVYGMNTSFNTQLSTNPPTLSLYNSKIIVPNRPGRGTITCASDNSTCNIVGATFAQQVQLGDRLLIGGVPRVIDNVLSPSQVHVYCPYPSAVTNAAFQYDSIRQVMSISGSSQLTVDQPFLPDLRSGPRRGPAQGASFLYYVPYAGTVSNIKIANNLLYDIDTVKWNGTPYAVFGNGPAIALYDYIGNLDIEHNTISHNNNTDFVFTLDGPIGATISNNIMASSFPGQVFAQFISGSGETADGLSTALAGGAFQHNVLYTSTNPPLYAQLGYTDFFPANIPAIGFNNAGAGDFSLAGQSQYHSAGTDGKDVGVDMSQLPLIRNLNVQTTSNQATLNYTAPNSTTCILEVSTDPNLLNRLADYAVVPDVDPLFNPHSNEDNSAGNSVNGLNRSFVVGRNTAAQPNRALQPGTTYNYRLQCGGQGLFGTFVTGR